MRERLVIHAGMHKTGSTSIQNALAAYRGDAFEYVEWRQPNHSELFILMFEERPEEYWSFRRRGIDAAAARALRGRAAEALEAQLARPGPGTLVFSAERIATAPPEAVARMAAFFAPRVGSMEVRAYVRDPATWITSMFEQAVKTGEAAFTLRWPEYRRAFDKIDAQFGRERVHLRRYRGEAVADFAAWAGLGADPGPARRDNARLGAAGFALLYYLKARMPGPAAMLAPPANGARAVETLRGLGGPDFALAADAVAALAARRAEDLAWIAGRLGDPAFGRAPAEAAGMAFGSEEDILRHAVASGGALGAALGLRRPLWGGAERRTRQALGVLAERCSR